MSRVRMSPPRGCAEFIALCDLLRIRGFVPHELAQLIADALACLSPEDPDTAEAAERLAHEFEALSTSLYFLYLTPEERVKVADLIPECARRRVEA